MTIETTTEENNLICCEHCNQFVNTEITGIILIDSTSHCEDCATICETCNTNILRDDSFWNDTNNVSQCETCYDREHTLCHSCGETHHRSNGRRDYSGEFYCDSCADEYLYVCYSCDDYYHTDNMYYSEHDDNYRCESCHECHLDDHQETAITFAEYTNTYCNKILAYDSKPDFIFSKQIIDDKSPLYLGIELELNFDLSKFSTINKITRNYFPEKYIFKADSSIGEGAELVLSPLSYNTLKTINFKNYFKELKELGVTSYESGKCGLHVHLSDNKDEFHLKAKTFFYHNRNKIAKFSQRTDDDLNRWARIEDNINGSNCSRYVAINQTDNTNEIRIFRGTLYYPRFKSSLIFCCALHHFLNTKKLETLQKKCPNFQDFKNFLKINPSYNYLLKYLNNKNI